MLYFLILLLILIIIIVDYNIKYTRDKKIIIKDKKISLIVLSYNRPHNLKYSLPILCNYKIIDEIIVSHGKQDKYFKLKNKKVRHFKDYGLDKQFGGARRFMRINNIKNDIVLFIDDDKLPSEYLIEYTLMKLLSNKKNTIYGYDSRYCYQDGYSWMTQKNNKYNFNGKIPNVVITNYLMCKKKIITEYLNSSIGFDKYKRWLIKYKGNCEDISLSLFVQKYYNEYPINISSIFMLNHLKDLDKKNGYSSNTSHLEIRKNFCKKYN